MLLSLSLFTSVRPCTYVQAPRSPLKLFLWFNGNIIKFLSFSPQALSSAQIRTRSSSVGTSRAAFPPDGDVTGKR